MIRSMDKVARQSKSTRIDYFTNEFIGYLRWPIYVHLYYKTYREVWLQHTCTINKKVTDTQVIWLQCTYVVLHMMVNLHFIKTWSIYSITFGMTLVVKQGHYLSFCNHTFYRGSSYLSQGLPLYSIAWKGFYIVYVRTSQYWSTSMPSQKRRETTPEPLNLDIDRFISLCIFSNEVLSSGCIIPNKNHTEYRITV